MLKSYKTEINPTQKQIQKINKTIGVCRFVYNFYIAHNKEIYENERRFVSGMDFSKWLNNEYLPKNQDMKWIKEVSSKATKQAIMNGDKAFKNFFKGVNGFPKFKKKNKSDVKMYFVKNNPKDCFCERHRINIPTLGWIKLKEKGYIPTTKDGYVIKSGTVSCKAGKYYVSVLIDISDTEKPQLNGFGLGIDLGVKEFAVISNGIVKKNINKTAKLKKNRKTIKKRTALSVEKIRRIKETQQ